MVIWNNKPFEGLIVHSDRGSQYCSHDYRNMVEKYGFQVSMSKRGDCYDNAPIESFWRILKKDWFFIETVKPEKKLKQILQNVRAIL